MLIIHSEFLKSHSPAFLSLEAFGFDWSGSLEMEHSIMANPFQFEAWNAWPTDGGFAFETGRTRTVQTVQSRGDVLQGRTTD